MILLRVNGRDLSAYVQAQHDAGLDLDPEYSEPQFAGNAAISEGLGFTADATGNREWTVPLLLDAEGRPELHSLIRDINSDLVQGADVEFASDATDDITHFDLERGRLDVTYQYFLTGVHHATRAVLKLWTRPFGHTGTARLVASIAGTGIYTFDATGVVGDTDALARLSVRVGSVANRPRAVFYAVKHPVPSGFDPIFQPTSVSGGVTASLFGASGRVGSQYVGYAVVPTQTTPQKLFGAGDRIPAAWAGRYRVLALGAQAITGASGNLASGPRLTAKFEKHDPHLTVATLQQATVRQAGPAFVLHDYGEITVGSVPTQFISLDYTGASGATARATYPIQIDEVMLLSLDTNAAIYSNPSYLGWVRERADFDAINRRVQIRDTTGSTVKAENDVGRLRGDYPQVPAVGSPMASGPAQIIVGANDPFGAGEHGNSPLDVELYVRERFRFLR